MPGARRRTLVVSDFHLGTSSRYAVLQRPEPRRRLLQAIGQVDRLVLLGDIVELSNRPARAAMRAAEPVLRSLGEHLRADAETILVPGNHDRALVTRWIRGRGTSLALDCRAPLDASPELSRIAAWLGPASVRVHYPGVWLAPGTWATHGHYLNRHLLPRSSVGFPRGPVGSSPQPGARPYDYEPRRGRGRSTLRVPASVLRRLAPLIAPLLSIQMRRASIPALMQVVQRLGVEAEWVLFGHVHRLGPRTRDRAADWAAPADGPRVLNTGSWVYQPLLVRRAVPPHPYWPGGAVLISDDEPPKAVGLLDGLTLRRSPEPE